MDNPQIESNCIEEGQKDLGQPKTERHVACEKAFAEILKQGSTHEVFIACTKALRQYHLEGMYDAAFVLNNTYLRALKALEKGKEITNYPAWIRATNFHSVQELSKAEKKNWLPSSELDIETLPDKEAQAWTDDDLDTVEQQYMRKALATLSPLEQAILQLKVVEGLRWDKIQAALITSGFESFSPNLLSQKKRRAFLKLKQNYQRISKAKLSTH
jgi:DNA-directed RNA polymerase specialized sigma24 family protein